MKAKPGTDPNVRLVESEAVETFGRWAFVTVGVAIGFLVGQLTHWIF